MAVSGLYITIRDCQIRYVQKGLDTTSPESRTDNEKKEMKAKKSKKIVIMEWKSWDQKKSV